MSCSIDEAVLLLPLHSVKMLSISVTVPSCFLRSISASSLPQYSSKIGSCQTIGSSLSTSCWSETSCSKHRLKLSPSIFQSCQNVGKKFSLRFFSAGGNRRKCGDSYLAKMSAKSFRCAFFQLAGTKGIGLFVPPKCRQKVFVALEGDANEKVKNKKK